MKGQRPMEGTAARAVTRILFNTAGVRTITGFKEQRTNPTFSSVGRTAVVFFAIMCALLYE